MPHGENSFLPGYVFILLRARKRAREHVLISGANLKKKTETRACGPPRDYTRDSLYVYYTYRAYSPLRKIKESDTARETSVIYIFCAGRAAQLPPRNLFPSAYNEKEKNKSRKIPECTSLLFFLSSLSLDLPAAAAAAAAPEEKKTRTADQRREYKRERKRRERSYSSGLSSCIMMHVLRTRISLV